MWLGIDFGTCYSSAAIMLQGKDKKLQAIREPLKHGYSFPSCVYVTEQGEILIGQAAVNQHFLHPERFRSEFKRDLGSIDPYILGNQSLLPEELATAVIHKLKNEAERTFVSKANSSIENAIITVPATYKANKRALMQQAGEAAGFNQVRLWEEPVAAAIYYARQYELKEGDIILVYDLGAGTFDATLLHYRESSYQILAAPVGLEHCGGADFDRLIYQNLLKSCSPALRERLDRSNRTKEAFQARAIVGNSCRELKHQLSEAQEGEILIPITMESYHLTRQEFEDMIAPLVAETTTSCEQLVQNAGIEEEQISQVLLVGGSCRIPYVRKALEEKVRQTPLMIDDPELAVCMGAAIGEASPSLPHAEPLTQEPFLIVSPMGAGHYRTINEAIKNARVNNRIRVLPGIYRENLVIDQPLEIFGEGQVSDIVIESTDSSCISMQTEQAYVRGFTLRCQAGLKGNSYFAVDISTGQLVLEDCDITSDSLACVGIHGSATNPVIKRCKIHDGKQGGIFLYENAKGTVEDCDIFSNALAGLEVIQGSNLTSRRCQIHDGKSWSILFVGNSQGTLEDCEIFNCVQSGVIIQQVSKVTIRRCQIHEAKQCGILICESGEGTVEGCKIFGNAIAGVHCKENGGGTVEDCQIFGNDMGIDIRTGGNPMIKRCHINRNSRSGIFVCDKGMGTVEDCDLTNNSSAGSMAINVIGRLFGNVDKYSSGLLIMEGCPVIRRRNKE